MSKVNSVRVVLLFFSLVMLLSVCADLPALPTLWPSEVAGVEASGRKVAIVVSPVSTPVSLPTLAPTATVQPTLVSLPTNVLTPTMSPAGTSAPLPATEAAPSLSPADTPVLAPVTEAAEIQTPTLTPTLACETDTASTLLSASAENLKLGDVLKIKVTLNNEGCVALGLPQYRLYIQSNSQESIFTPNTPEAVVHYLSVEPGQSDTVEFDLTAVASGPVTITASASFEVHLEYPTPAYWGYSGSGEFPITVLP
ncbi:MAG: hypothetical protein JXA21_16165 [Anaerolineae bacterium]|nr:hypothetical protein [Anaerolineae bacterium]